MRKLHFRYFTLLKLSAGLGLGFVLSGFLLRGLRHLVAVDGGESSCGIAVFEAGQLGVKFTFVGRTEGFSGGALFEEAAEIVDVAAHFIGPLWLGVAGFSGGEVGFGVERGGDGGGESEGGEEGEEEVETHDGRQNREDRSEYVKRTERLQVTMKRERKGSMAYTWQKYLRK